MSINKENVPFSLSNQNQRSIDARVGATSTFSQDFDLTDDLYGNYILCQPGVATIGYDSAIQDGFTATIHNDAGADIDLPIAGKTLLAEGSIQIQRVSGAWRIAGESFDFSTILLNRQYQFINDKTTIPANRVLTYDPTSDDTALRYHIFIEDTDDPFEFILPAGLDPGWNGKVRLTGSGSVVLMAGQGTMVTTESGDYDVGPTETPVATGVIGYKYGVVDVQHLGGDNWLVEGDLA